MESSTSYVLSFRMVFFFDLVTTGRIGNLIYPVDPYSLCYICDDHTVYVWSSHIAEYGSTG